jgi:hypothetical protein
LPKPRRSVRLRLRDCSIYRLTTDAAVPRRQPTRLAYAPFLSTPHAPRIGPDLIGERSFLWYRRPCNTNANWPALHTELDSVSLPSNTLQCRLYVSLRPAAAWRGTPSIHVFKRGEGGASPWQPPTETHLPYTNIRPLSQAQSTQPKDGPDPEPDLSTSSQPPPPSEKLSAVDQFRSAISEPVVAAFCAGGVAGAVSRTVVSPLERLKILFQVQSAGRDAYKLSVGKALAKMWKEEGWRGFMRGNGTNCIRIVPYSAVQFGSYNFYKRVGSIPCSWLWDGGNSAGWLADALGVALL